MRYYIGATGRIINHNLRGHFFISRGEIFTEKELEKRKINKLNMVCIETPKNNTYKIFGERYVKDNENVKLVN